MADAGFTDLVSGEEKWPINNWPYCRDVKFLGRCVLDNLYYGLDALFMALLTRYSDMTWQQAVVLTAAARNDLINPDIHAYLILYVFVFFFSFLWK